MVISYVVPTASRRRYIVGEMSGDGRFYLVPTSAYCRMDVGTWSFPMPSRLRHGVGILSGKCREIGIFYVVPTSAYCRRDVGTWSFPMSSRRQPDVCWLSGGCRKRRTFSMSGRRRISDSDAQPSCRHNTAVGPTITCLLGNRLSWWAGGPPTPAWPPVGVVGPQT